MDDYISISMLNDFIFCPYSIYLHNVYMDADEGLYHAKPQTRGKVAHAAIDEKTGNMRKGLTGKGATLYIEMWILYIFSIANLGLLKMNYILVLR